MNKILLLLFTSMVLFSCNNEKSKEDSSKTDSNTVKKSVKCYFSVKKDAVKFEWTAFKTTAKIGVKGSFDNIVIINDKTNVEIPALIKETAFEINLATVNSANEARDKKLVDFFFGKLSNTTLIKGYIHEATGSTFEGKAAITLEINEIKNTVDMNYTYDKEVLTLKGDLDLLDWKAEKSLDALHGACKDLHTGKDGVSKTWSEMHIEVIVPLNLDCK